MGKFKDLAGQRFGRLVVLGREKDIVSGGRNKAAWRCECDCKVITIVRAESLKCGETKSCGCIHRERASKIMKDWARDSGLNYGTLKGRIKKGWPTEKALTEPTRRSA